MPRTGNSLIWNSGRATIMSFVPTCDLGQVKGSGCYESTATLYSHNQLKWQSFNIITYRLIDPSIGKYNVLSIFFFFYHCLGSFFKVSGNNLGK